MNLLVAPIVVPILGAALCLALRRSLSAQRWVGGVAAVLQVAVAGWLCHHLWMGGTAVLPVGNWPGAYGIVLVADLFSALLLLVSSLTLLVTWWFTIAAMNDDEAEQTTLHPLLLLLSTGVNWAFLAGDLFNLFVSFEVMLLASYAVLTHGGRPGQVREGLRFVILNLFASSLFLCAAGLMYGLYGSLNMAELAIRLAGRDGDPVALAMGTLFLLIFGSKAALFPIFAWLPDAYPKGPATVLPFFAGVLTKVGIYCLYRTFTLMFPISTEEWFQPVMLALAGGSMIVAVLGALSRWTMRHILSFHIISQIGYMMFGLALFTPLGLAAGILFMVHHIPVKASLFLVAGIVQTRDGSDELGKSKPRGLMNTEPLLALLFLLPALSLAGIPPLSGFYGKFALVYEGLADGHPFYVGLSIVTSLLTFMSMVKIWKYAFWGEPAEQKAAPTHHRPAMGPLALLVSVSMAIAIFSGPLMQAAQRTADQMRNPAHYIEAVLGEPGAAAYRDALASRGAPGATVAALGEEVQP